MSHSLPVSFTSCLPAWPCAAWPCAAADARVTWRYAVLSNMVLMFAAPPASAAAAVPLLRHCLALLRSDMLLLRQVGGAGLWLQLAQVAYYGAHNDALLQELKAVGASVPGSLCMCCKCMGVFERAREATMLQQ